MQIDRIAKYITLGALFLVPLIPLVLATFFYFPFVTGKNFAFRILVEIMLGGWLVLALRNSLYRIQFSWVLAALAAFVAIIGLADVLGAYPLKSIWSNFERMEGWITLAHLLAYFVVAGTVLRASGLWNWFWNTWIGVSIFLGFYGIIQLLGFIIINQGGDRLDATFGNATYLAGYMLASIFITLFMFVRHQGASWVRFVYGGALFLQVFTLYFTATRGAILGLMVGALVTAVLIALFERERPWLRKWAVGTIAVVVLLVGGFFAIRNTSFVQNSEALHRLASISLQDNTTKARFMVWKMAWEGVKERPILGWGQENFNFVFNKYYNPGMYAQEAWFDRVHNVVFDWLIAGGILGFLSYVLLFVAALYYLWVKREGLGFTERALFTGLLAGYTFHNLFVFDNIASYIFFISLLAYIHSLHGRDIQWKLPAGAHENRVLAPVIGVVVIALIVALNGPSMVRANTILQAISPQNEGAAKNLALFKETVSGGFLGRQEAREQIVLNAERGLQDASATTQTKQEFFTLAVQEMQKQLAEEPNDARIHVLLGSILMNGGKITEGLTYLKKAEELSPDKQAILFTEGVAYIFNRQYGEALPIFKRAFEIEPAYDEARLLYAVAAYYAKQPALGDKLLQERFGTVLVNDDRLVGVYHDVGNYSRVLEIWKKRVESQPNNIQAHVSLAAAYLDLGQRQNAIAELQKAMALDPSVKTELQGFIDDIKAGKR